MNLILKMLFAGISIGIASLAYINVGGAIGAILFSFGLIIVIKNDYFLFTGKAGFISNIGALLIILFFNIIGASLLGLLSSTPALSIVSTRLSTPLWKIFFLSIGCGFIMTNAVKYAKENQWLPLLFGIPTFIFCGFPHCVADVTYYASMPLSFIKENILQLSLIYIMTVLGNYVGCNIPTRLFKNNNS